MSTTKFHISTIFKAIDKFSGPVAKMTTRVGKFTRQLKKGMGGIGRMTKRVVHGMKSMAFSLGTLGVLGGFALKGLFSPAARFEKSMAGINAVTLGTITNMKELNAEARRLGRSTIFTATDVGGAMEILARAGLGGGEIKDSIEPVLRAAAAGGTGISETAKVVISSIKGMGMQFSDAKRVADTFALVASSAKTTIIELGEGLSKVAPVANQFGMRFENVVATVATLQDAGVEASMSGTQLKTMLTKLAMLTPKAARRFKQLGIEISRGGGNMKTMPNLIGAIAKGLDKAGGNMQKVKAIATAVGLRGSTAANLLASAWKSGKLPELLAKIADKAGDAATKMDELRQDTLMGDLTKLKSAWEGFRIDIATGSLPELRDLVQSLTEFFTDPANIEATAKKVSEAVTSLKAFWDTNGSELIQMAETTLRATELLAKVAFQTADTAFNGADAIDEFATYLNDSPLGRAFNEANNLYPQNSKYYTEGEYLNRSHLGTPYAFGKENTSGVLLIKVSSPGSTEVEVEVEEDNGIGIQPPPSGAFYDQFPIGVAD